MHACLQVLAEYSIAVTNINVGYRAVPLHSYGGDAASESPLPPVGSSNADSLVGSLFCRFGVEMVAWDRKGRTKMHGTYIPGRALQETETENTGQDTEREDDERDDADGGLDADGDGNIYDDDDDDDDEYDESDMDEAADSDASVSAVVVMDQDEREGQTAAPSPMSGSVRADEISRIAALATVHETDR